MEVKTLGIWIGFDYPLPLKREGISRFLFYLIKHLLKNYPIDFEIWCYELNSMEVTELFSELLQNPQYKERIKIITENTFLKISRWNIIKKVLNMLPGILYGQIRWNQPYVSFGEYYRSFLKERNNSLIDRVLFPLYIIFSSIILFSGFAAGVLRKTVFRTKIRSSKYGKNDPLASLANYYSNADCFLIYIVSLQNALGITRPKMIFSPDLVTIEFSDYFISQDPKARQWIDHIKTSAKKYAEQGAFFCGISEYGIKNQLLKFITNVKEEKTAFIYLASMKPDNTIENILNQVDITKKYNIDKKYIFYPTQLRPYKNVITLLKALKSLRDKGIIIQLVLTGNLEHDSKAYSYAMENNVEENIVFCGSLPEPDLYCLYHHAEMMVSPSLFEGGFPLQTLEALFTDTPAIVALIPVTLERLKWDGFDPESCGLKLFEPEDENELADKIMEVLKDREKAVADQKKLKEKMLSYTWDDVARQYYELFLKILNSQDPKNTGNKEFF